MRVEYTGCPLCGGSFSPLLNLETEARGNAPRDLWWVTCDSCGHVHTQHYWTKDGLAELFAKTFREQIFGGELDQQRATWGYVIDRLRKYLPDTTGRWIDVGMGNGSSVFTAAEYGFDAVGLDLRTNAVDALRTLGYQAEVADAMTYDYRASVVILADILEHVAYPKELLKRIRTGLTGALFVSCPNMDCVSWRYLNHTGRNFYWREIEHHHNFTRRRLEDLLRECGFTPVEYAVSHRYQACMEIVAV